MSAGLLSKVEGPRRLEILQDIYFGVTTSKGVGISKHDKIEEFLAETVGMLNWAAGAKPGVDRMKVSHLVAMVVGVLFSDASLSEAVILDSLKDGNVSNKAVVDQWLSSIIIK